MASDVAGGSHNESYSIKIYGRIKPLKKPFTGIELSEDANASKIAFHVPKQDGDGLVNNKKEVFAFKFDHIFPDTTTQEEIFDVVARPVVDRYALHIICPSLFLKSVRSCVCSVLQGYNGTLFAYGQTGTGKTFTITGGAEKFSDRGIFPRALAHVFETIWQVRELPLRYNHRIALIFHLNLL